MLSLNKNITKLFLITLLAGALALSAEAAKPAKKQAPAAVETAAPAKAEPAKAEPAKASGKSFAPADGEIEFHAVGRPAMLKIVGKSAAPKGQLTANAAGLSGKLNVALDNFDTGMNLRNQHMKEKYLETAKFPEAELTLDPVALAELSAGVDFKKEKVPFTGKLKLHGEEKPVAGEADISREAGKLGVKAGFVIKTGDFKIDTPKYMGITVAEDVKVAVNFNATESK